MVVLSLTQAETDAALTRSLTFPFAGRSVTVCRSLSPLDLTSYHGTADAVTVVLGKSDAEHLRAEGVCDVTVGFSRVRLEVNDGCR